MALTRSSLPQEQSEELKMNTPECVTEEIQSETEPQAMEVSMDTSKGLEAFDPETVTRNLVKLLQDAWDQQEKFLFRHCSEGRKFLTGLKDLKVKDFQTPESVVGFLSGVSGGKSSYMNAALCHYPICPVAHTTTTICAVELRRAHSMAQERIDVCLLTDENGALDETPVRTFGKQVLSEALFQELLDYTSFLVDRTILCVEDTLDFFLDEDGELALRRTNWRHCMVLLMIVLDAYVFQDKRDTAGLKYQKANVLRDRLLEKMGIPLNQDYGIRLYWHSEDIPDNTVLVDLPGLGSATQNTGDQLSHTNLTANFLAKASALLCFVNEKATLESDTLELLNSFIKTNTLKGGSSARLTFVLHKADILEGRTADQTNRRVKTSIDAFRNSYPFTAEYPVYALSSFNGEWLMLDEGILPQNLHHAGSDKTGKELSEYLRKRYEMEYPYQLTADSGFGLMNYETFNQTLLGDHVRRVHFLTSIEAFREYVLSVTAVADIISAEQAILKIAGEYQPKLAEELAGVISTAAADTKETVSRTFARLTNNMERAFLKSQQNLEKIAEEFFRDYQKLSEVINDKLRAVMEKLERQGNNIPIDGSITGSNQIGNRNKQHILDGAKAIGEIEFVSYFNRSFSLLKGEFDMERKLYQDTAEEICRVIKEFPDQVVTRMEAAFANAVKDKTPAEVVSFRKALDLVKDTTRSLLVTLCEEYVINLRKDRRVEQSINATSDNILKALLDLLEPYKSAYYGVRVLNKIEKFRFFRASIIDAQKLESFLTEYYVTNFRTKMENTLIEQISGKVSTADSHFFRVKEALKGVNSTISDKSLQTICDKASSASDVTKTIITSPAVLGEWKLAVDTAAKEAQQVFCKDSVFAYLNSVKEPICDASWANEATNSLLRKIENAHSKTAALVAEENRE